MKKLLALVALFGALVAAPAFAAVENGKPAPDIAFKDIKGAEHSIAGFKGKIVVLEWHNEGCPFVKKFYDGGAIVGIQEKALAAGDVVWVTVNSGAEGKQGYYATDEDAAKYLTEKNSKASAYVRDVSGAFGKLYGAKTTPHIFVIDKEGVLQYQGAIDSIKSADKDDIAKADNYLLQAVEAVAKGEKPATASSEPYGCNVKYND